VSLACKALCQLPCPFSELRSPDDATCVLAALAQGDQAREQLTKERDSVLVFPVRRPLVIDRLRTLCDRTLDAADGIISGARQASLVQVPPHLAQRELQERQAARLARHGVEQGIDQTSLESDVFDLGGPNDRLAQLLARHRA